MKKTLLLCSALFIYLSAVAQSMRDPTPSEKKVLMRVINPVNKNINLFVNNDWEITQGFGDMEMDVPNSPRAQLVTAYLVTLKLKEGNPMYNREMATMLKFAKEQKQDSVEAIAARLEKQSVIHIEIEINSESVGAGSMPGKNIPLNVPGANKAFIVAQDNVTTRRNGAYVLAFGSWQNARYDSDNKCYRFRFKHPPQSPFVENAVIEMYGDTDRINEILKRSDWNNVTAALDK